MQAVPEHYTELLEEKYMDGLSVREMAERRRTSEKAIESALTRARAKFREVFHALTNGGEIER